MLLEWEMLRFQDETDCQRPDSKILDVKLEVTMPKVISEDMHEEVPGWVIQDEASVISTVPDVDAGDQGLAEGSRASEQVPDSKNPVEGRNSVGEAKSGNPVEDEGTGGLEELAEPEPRVVLSYETHAEADVSPFVVEPTGKVSWMAGLIM
jgi:hypothetical protein